jgi:PadR family transcriptional regulator, regulatory protein AphA
MSTPNLSPVSYLVLGLVERQGTATPYDLKRFASESIGNFWSFPHSQIYAESARLAELGLLEERREPAGRRRRTYSITAAGSDALRRWLQDPTPEAPQLRYLGLLKLFFGEFMSPENVVALARAEEEAHRARLALYESIDERLGAEAKLAYPRATLQMGILCEEAFVRFWSRIAEQPPARGRIKPAMPRGEAARPAAQAES